MKLEIGLPAAPFRAEPQSREVRPGRRSGGDTDRRRPRLELGALPGSGALPGRAELDHFAKGDLRNARRPGSRLGRSGRQLFASGGPAVAPLKVSVPATKSVTTVKWLCSCNVNPVTLFGRGARSCSREDYYSGHFLRPPTDVSLFCPGGHLPDALVIRVSLAGTLVNRGVRNSADAQRHRQRGLDGSNRGDCA
jgi:hypothetical protein